MLSKDVILAVLYKVYLVRWVISLVDTVQYSLGHLLTYSESEPIEIFYEYTYVLEERRTEHFLKINEK